MREIVEYLKKRGERLDTEIAAGTGIPLENVRHRLLEMSKKGDVILCHATRYIDGNKSEGMLCRIAGVRRQPPTGKSQSHSGARSFQSRASHECASCIRRPACIHHVGFSSRGTAGVGATPSGF